MAAARSLKNQRNLKNKMEFLYKTLLFWMTSPIPQSYYENMALVLFCYVFYIIKYISKFL